MTEKILVTGANGQHGGTGAHLAKRLLENGSEVGLFVRRETDTTDQLAAQGAEVVVGDLLDQRTIVPALGGVGAAYFTYAADVSIVSAAANWAQAIRAVKHRVRTVMMSMPPAVPDKPTPYGRAHWLAEQVMQWAGIDLQVVRIMAMFHENLEMMHRISITAEGVMRNAYGPDPIIWMSGADAADVMLVALLHPDKFEKPLSMVYGPEFVSHPQIAEMLSDFLGRPVRYEQIDPATWKQELENLRHPAITPTMLLHLPTLTPTKDLLWASAAPTGPRPNDAGQFERVTGHKPRLLADFLRQLAHDINADDGRPSDIQS
jgi:uncharacterized protein YbjT (DUF2867 family)